MTHVATEGSLLFLQSWYVAQLNGFWEHGNGVTIESLATPGWAVTIDLTGTEFEDKAMPEFAAHRTAKDWIVCKVDHNHIQGRRRSAEIGNDPAGLPKLGHARRRGKIADWDSSTHATNSSTSGRNGSARKRRSSSRMAVTTSCTPATSGCSKALAPWATC
jgi:hypothetical protein